MENASRPPSEVLRLLKPFLPWMALSVVTGICAGGATVALLATINQVLNRPGGLAGGLLLTFIALCATVLVCRATSDMSGNFVGQRLVAQLRKELAGKILAAPIDALERYRTHRLMPVLTQDVDMISDVAFVLASNVIALAIASLTVPTLAQAKRMGSGGYEAALIKLRGFEGQVSVMLGDQMFQEDIREAADRIENLECSEGG